MADITDVGNQALSKEEEDSCLWRIEQVYRELLAREAYGELDENQNHAIPRNVTLVRCFCEHHQKKNERIPTFYSRHLFRHY